MTNGKQREFLTVEEVAERLYVERSWVYSHADDLGVTRLGKYLRFYWPKVLERLSLRDGSTSDPEPIDPPTETVHNAAKGKDES
jgi:hypothetical protein